MQAIMCCDDAVMMHMVAHHVAQDVLLTQSNRFTQGFSGSPFYMMHVVAHDVLYKHSKIVTEGLLGRAHPHLSAEDECSMLSPEVQLHQCVEQIHRHTGAFSKNG